MTGRYEALTPEPAGPATAELQGRCGRCGRHEPHSHPERWGKEKLPPGGEDFKVERAGATAAGRTLPDEEPCKCHQSHAYVAPFHPGHCCFWPPTRTCHPEAVAEWERQSNLRWDMRSTPSSVVNRGR